MGSPDEVGGPPFCSLQHDGLPARKWAKAVRRPAGPLAMAICAVAVDGGDRPRQSVGHMGSPSPKFVESMDLHRYDHGASLSRTLVICPVTGEMVHFVHRQDHRLPAPALLAAAGWPRPVVRSGQAGTSHRTGKQSPWRWQWRDGDPPCFRHRTGGTVLDLRGGARLDAAGVHNVKGPSPPFTFGVQTVPVTPGVSSTMERRRPTSLLKSMDLPTLGMCARLSNNGARRRPWRSAVFPDASQIPLVIKPSSLMFGLWPGVFR